MFNKCTKITALPDISKWNTSKIENMFALFAKCASLAKLPDISKWNIGNVTNICGMFETCFIPNSSS